MATATIRLFLAHGDPSRLRTAELSNWSGAAVAGPRSDLAELFKRDESGKSGVYVLTGTDPDSGKPKIYIGEAESIRDRIKAHLDKDFWNSLTFFVSKDENLTKAHIRYLEGKLIERASEVSHSLVTNTQVTSSKLPESDRADMEEFLVRMYQLLPVLGIESFAPSDEDVEGTGPADDLFCDIKGLRAKGRRTPKGFLVKKGSQAVLHERKATSKYPYARVLREQLLANGDLGRADKHLVFLRDVEFSSPSAAAAVVQGGNANGLTSWKDAKGRTLAMIEKG